MSQAEHLLIDTDFTMGQIAQMIGYTDLQPVCGAVQERVRAFC